MKIQRILIFLIAFYVCGNSCICMAKNSEQDERKIRLLYQKAVELYEKVERENAHTVNVNGITMGYLDFGPKENVPLLWLHGSNSTGYEILNVKDGLIDAGYRVIAVDYRGHGKTQITDFNTSIYDVADDMAELLDSLFISKAVIGGWSKGGFIAAAFYDEYPGRTLGLLLEDGGSWSSQKLRDEYPYTEDEEKQMKEFMEVLKNSSYHSRFEMFKELIGPWVDQHTVETAARLLSTQRLSLDGNWVEHVDVRLMFGDYSGIKLKSPSRLPLMQWSQESLIPQVVFRNLDVPVHIFDPVSENDRIRVSHQNKVLKSLHPDLIEYEIYENTGHGVHLQRPKRFVESAGAFLKRVNSYP